MKTALPIVPIALLAGCASTGPSKQLVDARQAYENARTSDAAQYRPDAVLSARQALERAEHAYEEDAGSFREHSLAYVAEREAQKAYAWGQYEAGVRAMEQAEEQFKQKQANLLSEAEREKQNVQESLETTRNRLNTQQGTLTQTQAELAEERRARQEAEQRTALAIQSLEQVAKVKEEARGTVITLDGAVLFLTGQAELLPLARNKLNDVARALKEVSGDQKIVVEGHTDARGSDQDNMELSRRRAESVRDYLVNQGVDQARISAVGRGESQPLASNDSAEGRANNRRVEIIVGNGSATPGSPDTEGR